MYRETAFYRKTMSGVLTILGALMLANVGHGRADSLGPSVTTFHNGEDRHGAYVVPNFGFSQAARMHRVTTFNGSVVGHVYAQPLFWQPSGVSTGDVIVATESDHVTALDAVSGAVVWDQVLGTPVPKSALPCGNIDPLGITGTPVIDPAGGVLYVAAMVAVGGQPHWRVFAVSLADGSVLAGWPVDVTDGLAALGLSFDASVQGQRSALSLQAGQVFVAFGGHSGDCGNYHGWVVGIDSATIKLVAAWQTRGLKGGIWAAGGLAGNGGDLFVATGNTHNATTWSDGEAVIRLTGALQHSTDPRDFYAPSDWPQLDATDADIGSSNPTPLTIGAQHLIVATGKDGIAHVLDGSNLGGVGGALADVRVASGRISTGPVAWPSSGAAFMAFHAMGVNCPGHTGNGLVALRITPPPSVSVQTQWCAALAGAGSPIITTIDGHSERIIWVVGADGDDRLHGFNARTGAVVFNGGTSGDLMSNVHHFSTLIATNGTIYVPADNLIYAFAPQ
jgi:outer membrane protein assembly factor BamB